MTMLTYDSNQVSLSLAGVPLKGYADGEFLRIEMASDAFSPIVGTDGQVSRAKSNNKLANVTILLMQTSTSNDFLSNLLETDLNAPNGAGVGVLNVRDQSGRSIHRAAACWIVRAPNVAYGRDVGSREWGLQAVMDKHFVGGNYVVAP